MTEIRNWGSKQDFVLQKRYHAGADGRSAPVLLSGGIVRNDGTIVCLRSFCWKIQGYSEGMGAVSLEYYLKNIRVFAVKCQNVLAMCAKAVYNNNAIL